MSINLKQWIGATVTAKDDAIMYDQMSYTSGIIEGLDLTHLGTNQVSIGAGYGTLKGRLFEVTAETLGLALPSGTGIGRIYFKMDLSAETPIVIMSEATTGALRDLIQNENCNFENGTYEFELATYTASSVAITSITKTAITLRGMREEIDNVRKSLIKLNINVDQKLIGYTVTVTDGTTILTQDVLMAATLEFTLPNLGTWTYSNSYRNKLETINIEYYGKYTVTTKGYELYGYKIAKQTAAAGSRVSYMDTCDNANYIPAGMKFGDRFDYGDWGHAFFIINNKPCMLKNNGTVDYYLNPDNLAQKANSTDASDIANASYGGNAMASFPTCWVKRWEDVDTEYFMVSDVQIDDDYHAYAHERSDGTIMEYFYRSIYEGSAVNSIMRSLSGRGINHTTSGVSQLTYVRANGSNWYADTWSRIALIWDLLRLISRSTDCQGSFGYGRHAGDTAAPGLVTGTGDTKGQFWGNDSSVSVVVKVFQCENLWGNAWKLCEGLFYSTEGKWKYKMKAPYSDSAIGYNTATFGLTGASGGYQLSHSMGEYGLLPKATGGANYTYIPDGCWWEALNNPARIGGVGSQGGLCGFAIMEAYVLTTSNWACGCALTCEQPAA